MRLTKTITISYDMLHEHELSTLTEELLDPEQRLIRLTQILAEELGIPEQLAHRVLLHGDEP